MSLFLHFCGNSALLADSGRVVTLLQGSDPPVQIEADRVNYHQEFLEFSGGVIISRGEELLSGDYALYHSASQTAEISGNIRLVTPDFSAVAERVALNMDLELAKIFAGRAYFPSGHYYVSGSVLERQGTETLYVSDGVFTTCDGPAPSWSLTADHLLVNKEGVAESTGVTLRNAYFPMLYFPYLLLPVKRERQSGFLLPQVASSSRDGFMVSIPFFWAIQEDYDLTLLPIYRSKRGLAMTLEGRYNFQVGEGIWIATYLEDRVYHSLTYQSPGGGTKRVRNLFWLRAENNWKIADFDLNLDLDFVSDPLFLYAFRNDPDGFYYSRNLFNNYFGRTVNEELDPQRLSSFFAQTSGPDSYFRVTL
ncbi:MAG: hypothetical protein LBF22_09030, partial [Deltaproteobacteria bacterium]|nr:hypothetical protein [Deltaproteobacteria bacterium]